MLSSLSARQNSAFFLDLEIIARLHVERGTGYRAVSSFSGRGRPKSYNLDFFYKRGGPKCKRLDFLMQKCCKSVHVFGLFGPSPGYGPEVMSFVVLT